MIQKISIQELRFVVAAWAAESSASSDLAPFRWEQRQKITKPTASELGATPAGDVTVSELGAIPAAGDVGICSI
jgi:hypothetical protein